MLLAYTAGPYRDKRGVYYVTKNLRHAEDVAVKLWRMGFAVICPHLNTAHLDGCVGQNGYGDSDVFIKGDLEIVRRCDLVVLLRGYHRSEGTLQEMKCAKRNGIPLIYHTNDAKLKKLLREHAPSR